MSSTSMFSNGNGKPATFAGFNAKQGAFVLSKKDEAGNRPTFTQIRDVVVTRAAVKDDEYEGQPLRKLQLTLENGTERSIVEFNMAVGVVSKLVAMLLKADLSKPLGLSAQLRKEGSSYKKKDGSMSEPLKRDMADLSVYQGGYIRLNADELPPKTEKVTVGKKEVMDTSARDEWCEAKVAQLIAKLGSTDREEPHHDDTGADNSALADLGDDIPF